MKAYRTNLKSEKEIKQAVSELISKMTLEEKAGQLFQSVGADITAIGASSVVLDTEALIRKGFVGSMIQVDEPEKLAMKVRRLQEIAVNESRLGIPLLICQDVIHGFETVFPIPLAWSCSFNPELIRECVAISAEEAGCSGVDLAFSPMVDIVRDPRWGRVCESAGEDPFLGAQIAEAQVKGFRDGHLLSCLKHFMGYGAAEAGRDYNTVELSPTTLYNTYLSPFRKGIESGADSVMTSFNVIDGIPMVCNEKYTRHLLRDRLGFSGLLISDYGAFMETMKHGVASDEKEAAIRCFNTTMDIEMTTNYYISFIPDLVRKGILDEKLLDESVARILTKKYEIGLMDDPFLHINPEKIKTDIFSVKHLAKAEEIALQSAVLLENNGVLPLLDRDSKIALVGPYATDPDHAGAWSFTHHRGDTVTIYDGLLKEGFKNVTVEKATEIFDELDGGIERAVNIAKTSDFVVLAVGESSVISGEACSRQDITIPGMQKKLIEEILKVGKPTIMVLVTGRPLILTEYKDRLDAILLAWDLGSMAGSAIAKLLSGKANPSGRLTMSFPYSIGQIPVYYNALNTGRPTFPGSTEHFESKYLDGPVEPLYPFGYGLSYSDFKVEDFNVPMNISIKDKAFSVSLTVENIGTVSGDVVVQLYMRDKVALIARPKKELKGFKRVQLAAGKKKVLSFDLDVKELGFYDTDFNFQLEKGEFDFFIGLSSKDEDLIKKTVILTD